MGGKEQEGPRPGAGSHAPLRGEARVPGSKSIAIRALLAASLAGGRTRIAGLPEGEDVAAALELVAAAGARVTRLAPRAVAVEGRPPGPHRGWAPRGPLQAGESGTLARLATAALALAARAPGPYGLEVRGSLARRASAPLLRALAEAGAGIEATAPVPGGERAGWPVGVRPIGPPPDVHLFAPCSSQEVSALLLALSAWPGETRLAVHGPIPSRPYVELTLALLGRFGARGAPLQGAALRREDGGPPDAAAGWLVRGPLGAPAEPLAIEPDASAAAVLLAGACITGGELRVEGLGAGSLQGDVAIVEHLAAFGCGARAEPDALVAWGLPARGAELDLAATPDLAPVLAAVAGAVALRAAVGELGPSSQAGRSRLTGLGTLEGKESPRVTVLAGALRALGLAVEATPEELRIAPGPAPSSARGLVLDPRGDHRMAFAFALLGLARPGITVRGPACVAKSWPGFWSELERLRRGGR